MVAFEHLDLLISLPACGAVVVAGMAGRLARGAPSPWTSARGSVWSVLLVFGVLCGLGLSDAFPGVASVVQVWVAMGLCLLSARARPEVPPAASTMSAWELLVPMPPAVLTLGLWVPSLRHGPAPDGLVAGFSGGSLGSVSLSGVLLAVQVVLLLGVVGVQTRPAGGLRLQPSWDLHRLGGALRRAVSVGWLALAVWPGLLSVMTAAASVAAVLSEARPRRAGPMAGAPLSSVTLRSFMEANQRMGAELRAIEAEVLHAAARRSGPGSTHTPTLLRRLRGAHALTARLSQVSREEPGPRTLDSLAAIVDRAARRVDNPNQLELRIRRRGAAEAGLVDTDGVELALSALLQNAVDANDASGSRVPVELQIDTEMPLPPVAQHLKEAVRVRVVDTGSGLTEEDRCVCFEPFFTTRENREGLGLSLVGALVRVGDAVVDLAPRPERAGTVATLWLRWARPSATGSMRWMDPQAISGGADVLLVSADAQRRELLSLMLSERGVSAACIADWRGLGAGSTEAPRPWGLVVFPDASQQHDAQALVLWLSGLYAFVVAPPDLANQLVAKGLPEGRMQRAVTEHAEGVVEVVLTSLAETRGGEVSARTLPEAPSGG